MHACNPYRVCWIRSCECLYDSVFEVPVEICIREEKEYQGTNEYNGPDSKACIRRDFSR
jgi:hypothetical protein